MSKWLPNLVTLSRGLAGPLIAWLLIVHGAHFWAFFVFVTAMLTDLLDGWLAKRLDAAGPVGQWLDPVCDKFLTDATWLALWAVGWAPYWLIVTALSRDALVAAGWWYAQSRGLRWHASRLGQIAISIEGIALPVLLFHVRWIDIHWYSVGVVLGGLSLALSAASAVEYAVKGPRRDAGRGMNPQPWRAPPSTQT